LEALAISAAEAESEVEFAAEVVEGVVVCVLVRKSFLM
jgi:hypothetical protein